MASVPRILVTGAGSGVGQGIIKALRISGLNIEIIAADISLYNCGLYSTETSLIVPRVEQEGALESIISLIKANAIDMLLIGSEYDLVFYAENRDYIEAKTGCIVFATDINTIKIADDKWLTAQHLERNGLLFAKSWLAESIDDLHAIRSVLKFPLILKSRTGTSSRNVHIVKDFIQLQSLVDSTPDAMIQEMLSLPSNNLDHEYTCSVFKDRFGNILGPFKAKRTIRNGTSWLIEVSKFDFLDNTLLDIANSLEFTGSLNVQLMMTERGPVPFEINSRFSGTTAVRAHFGFNEPKMAVESYLFGNKIERVEYSHGLVMRYVEEVFIDGVSSSELNVNCKGKVNKWF